MNYWKPRKFYDICPYGVIDAIPTTTKYYGKQLKVRRSQSDGSTLPLLCHLPYENFRSSQVVVQTNRS
jgi:hypothetical protein